MFELQRGDEKLIFVWDQNKARTNRAAHRIAFEEAATVFGDANARLHHDEDHSGDQDRWIIIGRSDRERTLVVVFTEQADRIRLISARRANRRERNAQEDLRS